MEQKSWPDFHWLHESRADFQEHSLTIYAPAKSDYFLDRWTDEILEDATICNAPFYYRNVAGDFVMRVHVSHDFRDTYDAASVMVMQNPVVWAKACFEKTDFGTRAVVSVVTNHVSDDANGCNLEGNAVWFHYSQDGERYQMMRYFKLPAGKELMVGLVAQAPIGSGGERTFRYFSLEEKTVRDLRAGI